MSVTFSFAQYVEAGVEPGAILVHGIRCDHECDSPLPCEDHAIYGYCDHIAAAKAACGCERFDLNLSNANAAAVLERLGYEADPHGLYGEADPDDVLGRAMVANVGRDDSGLRDEEGRGAGGAVFIDCGRRVGYFDEAMSSLVALANEAKRRGVMVGWA